jgi:hypothetical protein
MGRFLKAKQVCDHVPIFATPRESEGQSKTIVQQIEFNSPPTIPFYDT